MAKKTKHERFQVSGLNSDFNFEHLTFADYIVRMREVIEKTRCDLTPETTEAIVDANSPYEWVPPSISARNPKTGKIKNGVLLIHGLFDSPYMLLNIANHFIARDYLVRAILLPGHGTRPGDLLKLKYNAWIKATEFGIKSFQHEVENFYICGFSTGALLALNQAYEHDNIKGIFAFSPAVRLQQQVAIISSISTLIGRTIAGIQWYSRNDDKDYAKYHSVTFNSARQVYLLTRKLANKQLLKKLDIPIFMALSSDDEVLSVKSVMQYFKKLPNVKNELYLYTRDEMLVDDNRIRLLQSHYPEKHIIDFSHVAIPVAPDHPHYGEYYAAKEAHYYIPPHARLLKAKSKAPDIYLGALTPRNLQKYYLKRLTYNPDFNNLMSKLNDFIVKINNET
ncbi:MAG: alpha/beta hydrolase [Gammaproteobacteria bacterium]